MNHLMLRVVDPERSDGGIVTHIDGIPWRNVRLEYNGAVHLEVLFFKWNTYESYLLYKDSPALFVILHGTSGFWPFGFDRDKFHQAFVNQLRNWSGKYDFSKPTEEEIDQMASKAIDASLYSQSLVSVLKRLGEARWQVVSESTITHMGSSETWVSLVSNDFHIRQTSSAPKSYKTVTLSRA